jgi:hypothetical protein
MIYFLVHNDYHLFDARHHVSTLGALGYECSLIEVPHSLNAEDRGKGFSSVTTIPTPIKNVRWPSAWRGYFHAIPSIKKILHPNKGDVLFLYTELELLNHAIVQHFKKKRAKIYLLEDGGVGSYLPFTLKIEEPYNLKNYIFTLMVRCLPGLWATHFRKFDGLIATWLPDYWLDGICLYRSINIERSVPVIVLNRQTLPPIDVIVGRVVFLNQTLYDGSIQTPKAYFDNLGQIMNALTNGFDEVMFKFHPREETIWIEKISRYLSENHPSVKVISDKSPFESQLAALRPEVVASFHSAPLLGLTGSGVQPMYMYHLLNDLPKIISFNQLGVLLTQWHYNFITTWKDACSGYSAGVNFDTVSKSISIADLVEHGID